MNNRVNYALVGFLVLFGLSLIVGFAYWMLRPASEQEVKVYAIHFNESVLGLNIDAPVKYRGISVGKVIDLSINASNSEEIEVLISVLNTTPIKVDTVAKLTAQGITGLTYINLSRGSHLSKLLVEKEDEEYPIIKTIPSFFKNFEKSLDNVSTQLSATLGRTEELLGTDNQKQMALLLKRSATVMEKIEILLNEETITHIQHSAKNIDSITQKVDNLMPEIHLFLDKTKVWENSTSASFDSIMISYLGLDKSMDKIQAAFHSGASEFKQLNAEMLPTMNATLIEMQELMVKFKDIADQYNDSPSDIFFKKEEIRKAPGEN